VVNILQVLTSLQDQTLSHVPRLLVTGATLFFHDAVDVAAPRALHNGLSNRLSPGAAVMNISLVQIIGALLTIGVRLTGIMLFAPFFGSVAIPPA
jgi:hypothetical protein